MRKLSDYVESAALEYWQETGRREVEPLWIATYFQDAGVMDDHPHQDLVAFQALVQKALTLNLERAEKRERLEREKAERQGKGGGAGRS